LGRPCPSPPQAIGRAHEHGILKRGIFLAAPHELILYFLFVAFVLAHDYADLILTGCGEK
jgi:hypothetical protein